MQGLEVLKPIVTALVLPPVPWLLLILIGMRALPRRPGLGRALIVGGVALVWLGCCVAPARWLHRALELEVPPLGAAQLAALKADADAAHTTILVLGGGMVASLDEPGRGELNAHSLQRLRVGVRLARATGWPLAFSGGRGWAQHPGIDESEAEAARRSAERDFGLTLAWIEPNSRDTAENASRSVPLLRKQDARRVLLVSDGWHLPRAQALFERASEGALRIVPAPASDGLDDAAPWLDWLPSSRGFEAMRAVLREALGAAFARTTGSAERQKAQP